MGPIFIAFVCAYFLQFASAAHAAREMPLPPPAPILRSEELSLLSTQLQGYYILGLREMLLDVQSLKEAGRQPASVQDPSCPVKTRPCEALVYGEKVCGPSDKPALAFYSFCNKNARPMELIIKRLKGNRDKWNRFADALDEPCRESRTSPACNAIQSRIQQIADVIVTPTSECHPNKLIEEIKLPFDASSEPLPALTLPEAQALVCESAPINQELMSERLLAVKKQIGKLGKRTDGSANYYRRWLTVVQHNLNACIESAKNTRLHSTTNKSPRRANLEINLDGAAVITLKDPRSSTTTPVKWLGRTLTTTQLNLCELQIAADSNHQFLQRTTVK